ncbi:holin [Clostridium gasigenes]|uniref:holin n=1 Tax=Clostridium gasigenes TaxID=94869 RepID=UPI001A9B39C1|nr:holin [Clostridium gasigenes]
MEKLKNYGLWISVIALIPMLCQSFGLDVLPNNYKEVSSAILGVFVLLGIVSSPTIGKGYSDK